MQFLKKLWKLWENRDIKLVTTERRRKYLVSEPNYHTTKFFTEHLLAIEMKKKQRHLWDALGFSILELSEKLIYEFWYDYVKPKYGEKAKFCYMGKDIISVKTDDIYEDTAEYVETRFDTSNY